MPSVGEIKKAIQAAGFEIYRTRGDVVYVAERVRENLLMDSGVFVDEKLSVGFAVRAQKSDFPNDTDDKLFERARELGVTALARGYVESTAEIRTVVDPGDPGRVIDRWCEVAYRKATDAMDVAIDELRFALTLEKAASPS
jgi:hypothetical protein